MSDLLLDKALEYSARGWATFFLPDSKVPDAGTHGFYEATFDDETINTARRKRMWHSHVAIATGFGSRVAVLDIDVQNGGSLEKAKEMFGDEIENTYTVRTKHGGWHLYFHLTRPLKKKAFVGMDFQADGGYVIAPPSPGYTVEKDIPLLPLPESIRTRVLTKERIKETTGAKQREGRHPTLMDKAKDWYRKGAYHEIREGSAMLQGWADEMLDLSDDRDRDWDTEIKGMVTWTIENQSPNGQTPNGHKPHRVTKITDFPAYLFPKPVADYITALSNVKDSDLGMAGLAVMGALSVAIGSTRQVHVGNYDHWTETPIIWGAVIAGPGAKKTPVINHALGPIRKVDYQRLAQYEMDIEQWAEEKRQYELMPITQKRLTKLRPEPVMKPILTGESTIEAEWITQKNNPRGTLRFVNELAALVRGFNSYKSGQGADRANFLNLWDGQGIRVIRKTSAPVITERSFSSVLGGIQPDLLVELKDMRGQGDGLIERFLFCFARPTTRSARQGEIPEDVIKLYSYLIDTLLGLQMEPVIQMEDERFTPLPTVPEGLVKPKSVYFTPDGVEEWFRLYQDHIDNTDSAETPYHLRPAFIKLDSYAGRFCLILHEVRLACVETTSDMIEVEDVRAAFGLVEYFKNEARKVFGVLATKPQDKQLDALWHWLREKNVETVELRDIVRAEIGGMKKRDELVPLIHRLMDDGRMEAVSGVLDEHGSKVVLRVVLQDRK